MAYNPLNGEGWDAEQARALWSESMSRSRCGSVNPHRWQLRGAGPGAFYWTFFDFKPYTGEVSVQDDGFHWLTRGYETAEVLHEGVTTSLYEAYQSVEQNRSVKYEGDGQPVEWPARRA